MKKIVGFITVLVLFSLTACVGIQTDVGDIDRFTSKQYQQYAWATEKMTSQQGRSKRGVMIDNAIREAVDSYLGAKGYQSVATADAEFVLDYRVTRTISVDEGDRMATPKALEGAFDAGSRMADPGLNTEFVPESIKETFFRFSARDAVTKKELWHGTASKIKEEKMNDEKTISSAANKVASKLFSVFPSR